MRSIGNNFVLDNKNDEKQQQQLPTFPRINVKDRDQGGPKAPPRNKMAVCEQLIAATSTQRITGSSAAPNFPFPPPKYRAIAPLAPAPNYVGSQDSTGVFATSSGSASSAEQRLPLYSYNAAKMNFPTTSHKQSSIQLPPHFPIFDDDANSFPIECKFPAEMKPAEYVKRNSKDKNNSYSDLKMFQQIHTRPQNGGNKEFPKSVERYAEGYSHRDVIASGTIIRQPKNVQHIAATESCTKAPHVDDMRGPAVGLASRSRPRLDCEYRLPESQNVSTNKVGRLEVSTSSGCNVNISPGDIIAVIGEEAFLKLGNEMIRHQREFAAQIFELHRLVTVQRLITRSLKKEAMDKQVKPSSKSQNLKELQRGCSSERQDGSSRTKSSSESTAEMLHLRPREKNFLKVPSISPKPGQETSARNHSKPAFANPVRKTNTPWIYPQLPAATANHGLVPVMSPSEGIIYKPYPIPPSPSSATIPSGYGSGQPFFINPSKTVPAVSSSQQPGIRPFIDIPPYFSPYAIPSSNTVTNTPASEHGSKAVCSNQNVTLTESSFRSSWNFSSQITATASHVIDHALLPAAKESAYQDSTASSSPPDAAHPNVLPLFPLEPTEIAMLNKQRKVIKVVAHNDPKSATESAARIFQSIQDERKQ